MTLRRAEACLEGYNSRYQPKYRQIFFRHESKTIQKRISKLLESCKIPPFVRHGASRYNVDLPFFPQGSAPQGSEPRADPCSRGPRGLKTGLKVEPSHSAPGLLALLR